MACQVCSWTGNLSLERRVLETGLELNFFKEIFTKRVQWPLRGNEIDHASVEKHFWMVRPWW